MGIISRKTKNYNETLQGGDKYPTCQDNPRIEDPNGGRSFTSSIKSFHKAARREYKTITTARNDYAVAMTLRIDELLTCQQHKKLWSGIARALKGHVFWAVRQPSQGNRIHYHFCFYWGEPLLTLGGKVVSTGTYSTLLTRIIRKAVKGTKIALHCDPKTPDAGWIGYCLETNKLPKLFTPKTGLSKTLHSNKFFSKPKNQIYGEYAEKHYIIPAMVRDKWREDHPDISVKVETIASITRSLRVELADIIHINRLQRVPPKTIEQYIENNLYADYVRHSPAIVPHNLERRKAKGDFICVAPCGQHLCP